MHLRNRWLIVVLICGIQLIAALGMIWYQLLSFEHTTISCLGNQSALHSQTIAKVVLEQLGIREAVRPTTDVAVELRQILEHSTLAGDRFVGVFDLASNQLFDARLGPTNQVPTAGHSLDIVDLETEEQISVNEWLSIPSLRFLKGSVQIGGVSYFVVINRLRNSNNALIVGQVETDVTSRFSSWMNIAKVVCFNGVLLLGFMTLFLITSILQKFENRLAKFHLQLQDMVEVRTSELSKTKNGVIFGLAKLAESRDNDTGDHLDRIRSYVVLLAREMQSSYRELDEQYIRNLALASSLHDIGKVGIPDAVLLKPGRLTDLERKIMQFHTTIGFDCLEAISDRIGSDEFLNMARDIAKFHHERWDGKGYPDGVFGKDIPLSARIVSVADVYDALTSRRPYKEPMSHEKSTEIIISGAGSQFDPEVVEAFKKIERQFKKVMTSCQSQLDDNAIIPAIARLQDALQAGATDELLA